MQRLTDSLWQYIDTCHVYVIKNSDTAVLIDFGDGTVLDALPEIGVHQVTDVLVTHHHRDQVQGLQRALEHGARIWVPQAEQDLFRVVDLHWQARPLLNNYDVRQDRFSLLEPVSPVAILKDYHAYDFGGFSFQVVPTPGHTPGSLTLFASIDGQCMAFTGDLIAGPGKVWSMPALQWSYHSLEGAAASIPSLIDMSRRSPDWLLPSHGEIMDDPQEAIRLLVHRLRLLLDYRQENTGMPSWLRQPYVSITPHLLRNLTSLSNSYVLLSESGKALLIDYGYDFLTTILTGSDRSLHRPWLYTLPYLKEAYGVRKIDVVIPTHYHDDHVAGCNLLREVEGTRLWVAEHIAPVLEHPDDFDLPCLWYDPIPVDLAVPCGVPVTWEEYSLTFYPLPGHTTYAAAISFSVDGQRVLATGDQYHGEAGIECNPVYQNGFSLDDYIASAEFYRRLDPDLILPGHWEPLWVKDGYFDRLCERGETLARLHRDLLPLETYDLRGEDRAATILPYHCQIPAGLAIDFQVEVRNPLKEAASLSGRMVLPTGWQSLDREATIHLDTGEKGWMTFCVQTPFDVSGRRFRLAVDITAGNVRLGQQAEALVDILQAGKIKHAAD